MTPDETLATPPPAVYLMPPANPIASGVKITGIFFAIFAAFYLAIFLYIIIVVGAGGLATAHAPAVPGSRASEQSAAATVGIAMLFGGAFSAIFAIFGALNLVAAIGLLRKKSWGRTMAIVAAVPLLISIPFGTILSICTFVVMLGTNAKENYARLTAGG
jgi:hypothetical protein